MKSEPRDGPWRPKTRRRRARLTRKVVVAFEPKIYEKVKNDAHLYGYTVSAFIRACAMTRDPGPKSK
jgi:hypothetical protein